MKKEKQHQNGALKINADIREGQPLAIGTQAAAVKEVDTSLMLGIQCPRHAQESARGVAVNSDADAREFDASGVGGHKRWRRWGGCKSRRIGRQHSETMVQGTAAVNANADATESDASAVGVQKRGRRGMAVVNADADAKKIDLQRGGGGRLGTPTQAREMSTLGRRRAQTRGTPL